MSARRSTKAHTQRSGSAPLHPQSKRCWPAFILALFIAAMAFHAPSAQAQGVSTAPPAVFSPIDGNGVDLFSGEFNITTNDVSIGRPDLGGLFYSRFWIGAGWRDSYTGTIDLDVPSNTYTVSIGSESETFAASGGLPNLFPTQQFIGSTLRWLPGTQEYRYATATGIVAYFAPGFTGNPWGANALVTRIEIASGERLTFHYVTVNVQQTPAARLQSVTNNLGYQLHFEYANNNPQGAGDLPDWKRVVSVTAINNAVDYCDPMAATCTSLTVAWPSAAYAISGAQETVTDPLSRTTRFTYSGGNLVAIRRPTSTDDIAIGYANGRVASVANGAGTWSYSYSDTATERTTTVTDPLSHTRVAVSNLSLSRIIQDTDGEGRTFQFQYDANGRRIRIIAPEDNYTHFTYDNNGNVTETRQVAKPGSGLADIVTSAVYPGCSSYWFRTCGLPTSVTDARGFRRDFAYDSTYATLLAATDPAPSGAAPVGSGVRPQTRFAYESFYAHYKNSAGQIVAAAQPVRRLVEISSCATQANCDATSDETIASFEYGGTGVANNRLPVSSTAASGDGPLVSTRAFAYDNIGNLVAVDGPLSGTADTTRFRYDAARQLIGVIGPDPDGGGALKHRAQRISYNVDGQPTSVEFGAVDSQSDPHWAAFLSLQQINTSYDFIGRPTQLTFNAGGSTHAVQQASYDDANRLTCAATRLNPAAFGSLPSSACGLGAQGPHGPDRIAQVAYNEADQPTSLTSGHGTSEALTEWTAAYGASGLVATLADAAGNLVTYEYDGFDRLRRIRFPNAAGGGSSATDYEQYSYDANSNVTQDRRRDGATITSTFDNLNRVTLSDASANGQDVVYIYDNFDRMLTAAIGGHTLTFAYDQFSRVVSAQSPVGAMSYLWDAAGRRTRVTWPDSVYAQYDYNLADDLTAIRENGASSGAGVLATYGYDNLGRRVSISRGNGTNETATFDSAGRVYQLAQDLAGTGDDQTLTLAYNAAGQIVSRTGSDPDYAWTPLAPGTANYAANGLNQYTSVDGTNQTHDNRGNRTTGGFSYDIDGNLTSGPNAAALAYDPLGRLYQTSASGLTTTRFLYDGAQMAGEYDASGALLRRYVPGPSLDEPVVWYEGSGTSDRRWLIADERGSVIAIADGTGAAANINRYDEFGIPAATNVGRFQYAGQPWIAEIGFYHNRARAYAPTLGRFQQPDPILHAGGMNLYAYVANDPMNWTDPWGLQAIEPEEDDDTITVTARRQRGGFSLALTSAVIDLGSGESFASDAEIPGGFVLTSPREPWCGDDRECWLARDPGIEDATFDIYGWFLPGLKLGGLFGRGLNAICCFEEGTLVDTAEGLRPIEEIEVGDLVLSRNPETGETAYKPVTALIPGHPRELWRVTMVVDGDETTFGTTDDHPWRTAEGRWLPTDQLREGMLILRAEGLPARVISATSTGELRLTYNLEVADWHTYFVGEERVWVHNACLKGRLLGTTRLTPPGARPLPRPPVPRFENPALRSARSEVGMPPPQTGLPQSRAETWWEGLGRLLGLGE